MITRRFKFAVEDIVATATSVIHEEVRREVQKRLRAQVMLEIEEMLRQEEFGQEIAQRLSLKVEDLVSDVMRGKVFESIRALTIYAKQTLEKTVAGVPVMVEFVIQLPEASHDDAGE